MQTLHEQIATHKRPQVLDACVRMIDDEVSGKGGLLAIPLKAGYKFVKGFKPGFVRSAMDFLLDEFCEALEPFYAKWAAQTGRPTLEQALRSEQDRVADSLLGVTDRRAQRSTNRGLVKAYEKLRGTAKKHVMEALPRLARTIEPFIVHEA